MLSRRQLRIRVMQALYAYFQGEVKDAGTAQLDLLKSNERSYDLYLQILLLFTEFARIEQMLRADAPKKFIGRTQVLENSLAENIFIQWLTQDPVFQSKVNQRKISWQKDQDLINKLFHNLKTEANYKDYVTRSDHHAGEQINFCKWILNFLKKSELFTHAVEEKNIFWAESLDLIAHMIEKTISGFDINNHDKNKLMNMYRDSNDDTAFMSKLLSSVIKNDEYFASLIADKTRNWDIDRIAIIDVILLKMALAEVTCFEAIPIKVSINEYLDISKVYSTPKSNVFINGIIDKLVADLKKDGKVIKTGRGLLE